MSTKRTVLYAITAATTVLWLSFSSVCFSSSDSLSSSRYQARDEIRDYKNDASSAAAQAQARYGGKVLNVSKSKSNGRTVFKVKLLLDSGRIKIVTIAE